MLKFLPAKSAEHVKCSRSKDFRKTSIPKATNKATLSQKGSDIATASTIKSKKEDTEKTKDGEILHKGIAKRYFSKAFTIADDVKVKGAELKDGLLTISYTNY